MALCNVMMKQSPSLQSAVLLAVTNPSVSLGAGCSPPPKYQDCVPGRTALRNDLALHT